MPTEKPVLSNLDRLNRHVAPLEMKRYASGGMVELLVKPRNMLFPQPPPFVQSLGMNYQKNPFRRMIPFGKPRM